MNRGHQKVSPISIRLLFVFCMTHLGAAASLAKSENPAEAALLGEVNREQAVTNSQEGESIERTAGKLYQAALQKIEDKAYWHATRELVIILDFYTKFSKIDGVIYYLGECLFYMDMYRSADKMYSYLVSNYPRSEYLPDALLGLQKLHYNSAELDNSLRYFTGITTRHQEEDVLAGSYYYGGMAYFHQKNFDEALNAFKRVSRRSDYFDYALYNVGLCFLKKKNIQHAVRAFRKLVSLPVIRDEQQDIVTAGHLTLGYIYYELGFYREAIKHFAAIPGDNDEAFKEGLLARSWAAIKLNDYQQAISTLNDLVKISDEDKYSEEARFLLGQCYLELGFYDFAINEFDFIIQTFSGKNNIENRIIDVEKGILEQRKMAENLRVELLVLESKLLELIPVATVSYTHLTLPTMCVV